MRITAFVHPRRTVGRVTGVGKFIANAPLALAQQGHDVHLLSPRDEWVENSPLKGLPQSVLPYRRRTIEWGGALLGRPRFDVEADWLWCPAESFVCVRGAKLAITAHTSDWAEADLPWANEWRYCKLRARWRLYYRSVRRSGARVLAVSEFLKRRLVEYVGIAGKSIHVVGHGVENVYYATTLGNIPEQVQKLQPYVLVTGGLSHYKGGDRIINIARRLPNLSFVVIGDEAPATPTPHNLIQLGYRDVQNGLPNLYANAVAALILSRYETFGLPAAEAMAAGAPVVVAHVGALPDVVGDAGFVVDGDDAVAIAAKLEVLCRDDAARAQLTERGRRRAEYFRWEQTGRRIASALESQI